MATKKASKKKAAPTKAAPTKAAPTKAAPKFEAEVMARAAADYADNKKAEDIVILDLRGISTVTDFMVICSVASMPQLRAVRDEIWDEFWKNHQLKPIASDTNLESLWIILHYGQVMVHVFLSERRDFYALEDLWSDAPRVDWSPPAPPAAPKKKIAAKKKAVTQKKKVTRKVAKKRAAKAK